MAQTTPSRSAIIPERSAPKAYPASRQSRYTPTAEALQEGCATSLIAARSVGYTIAVPTPRRTAPVIQGENEDAAAIKPIPTACTHIPQAIIHFLPTRSESAPVNSWHTPHTAGYVAAKTAILSTDR